MEKTCDECGSSFEAKTNAATRERFCSKKCRVRFWNGVVYRKSHPKKSVEERTRPCVVCSGAFVSPIWRPMAQTCSPKCSAIRINGIRQAQRAALRDLTPRICAECGGGFVPSKYSAHRNSFCSAKCARKVQSRNFQKRHPEKVLATNRRVRWGGNWLKAIERDGGKCQICGKASGLHVHHRDGSGETDSPNHALDNLQTLCRTCHKRVHTITYRIIDGRIVVSGLVFELLGATSVSLS